MYEENTTAEVFAQFIRDHLLPRLTHGFRRTILWDNLAAHFTGNVATNALQAAGHVVVARPSYSPDFAPIESAFSKVKYWLRRHKQDINADNLREAIEMAVICITADDCRGWFQGCHYPVPGRAFQPYLGMPTFAVSS